MPAERFFSKWGRCSAFVVAVVVALTASSCTTPTPSPRGIAPRVHWVFNDLHSVGGNAVQWVGAPTPRPHGDFTALHFNGQDDALILPSAPLQGLTHFTIEILLRPDVDGSLEQRFFHTEDQDGRRVLLELRLEHGRWWLDTYLHNSLTEHRALIDPVKTHPAGQWYWVALVYDGATMSDYVERVKESEGPVLFSPMTGGQTSIGVRLNRISWFKGEIRELRVYDQALTASQLSR